MTKPSTKSQTAAPIAEKGAITKEPPADNVGERPEGSYVSLARMTKGKIHPVIIFPFGWRKDNQDLPLLYTDLVAELDKDKAQYARPITVMDWKTYYTNARDKCDPGLNTAFSDFQRDIVTKHSDLVCEWCVDTCQMWNTGLGAAFNRGGPGDVYWLIPGDFFYLRARQKILDEEKEDVFDRLKKLPANVREHGQDFCIGEISVDPNSSKQLIDTYGTYGLLYNWFPFDAQQIRSKTDKPRSEFFAISGSFLEEVLRQRWYAYEQTIVILLQGIVSRKRIHRVKLGNLSDLPQGRDTLAAAMQQVERTERVLKMVWRERNEQEAGWIDRFRVLDQQSGQIRGAALIILQNLLA